MPSDSQPPRTAIIVNSSHPELDELAGELALRGRVHHYYGRYFPANRPWERLLDALPPTRSLFRRGPGRRVPPRGLTSAPTTQAGAPLDFAAGLIPRQNPRGATLYRNTLRLRDRAIVRAAQKNWTGQHAVIANHSVALEMFELARAAGRPRILNFPIAHPAYMERLLREEAELQPAFAADLLSQIESERNDLLDREIALADRILVGSTFAKRSFVEQGIAPDKLFVSPYGVDVETFAAHAGRIPDDTFRAVFVGQITQRKGIHYLFDAWRSFAGPGAELVLAGNITQAASACAPYASLYRYAGFLTPAELKQLYSTADVFVLPSLIEGMPLVVLQAMAARVPVIVSANGPGDIVRDGIDGFIVPIRDANAIADKLAYLRDHPEARAEMGRNAAQRARLFTWDRFRSQTADHVEQLL